MIEGGRTPVLSADELARLGFHFVLYPLSGLYAAAKSIQQIYQQLSAAGTTKGQEQHLMSFAEFNQLIGVEEKYELAERFRDAPNELVD